MLVKSTEYWRRKGPRGKVVDPLTERRVGDQKVADSGFDSQTGNAFLSLRKIFTFYFLL